MSIIRDRDFKTKTEEQIGDECFSIAIANNFIDTKDAFVGHIFGNNNFHRFYKLDEEGNIKGFTVIEFPKVEDLVLCYIGIVFVHPNSQGQGLSKELMNAAVMGSGMDPDLISLRTQNPRMFDSFVANFGGISFPNPVLQTPEEVVDVIRNLQCARDMQGIPNLSSNLIVRGAYPNSFVHQTSRNSFGDEMCALLGEQDAIIPTIITDTGRDKILRKSLIERGDMDGIKRNTQKIG
jgi:hypothetical protein